MRSAWESAAATSMAARAIPQALLEERLASGGRRGRRRHRVRHGRDLGHAVLAAAKRRRDRGRPDRLRHGLHAVHAGPGARVSACARCSPISRARRRWPPPSAPRPAPYFETPANPNLRLVDIQAVSAIARGKGLLTIVDNTFATPVLQRPWRWAPTWCCIRPPSTWAAMATCWPAPWPAATGRRGAPARAALLHRRDAVALHRLPGAARPEDAGAARAASQRIGAARGAAAARASGGGRCVLPGLADTAGADRAPPAIGRRRAGGL